MFKKKMMYSNSCSVRPQSGDRRRGTTTRPSWSAGEAYFVAVVVLACQLDAVRNEVRLLALLGVVVVPREVSGVVLCVKTVKVGQSTCCLC